MKKVLTLLLLTSSIFAYGNNCKIKKVIIGEELEITQYEIEDELSKAGFSTSDIIFEPEDTNPKFVQVYDDMTMLILSRSMHHEANKCTLQHQVINGESGFFDYLHQGVLELEEGICSLSKKIMYPTDFYTENNVLVLSDRSLITKSESIFEDSRDFEANDLAKLLKSLDCKK